MPARPGTGVGGRQRYGPSSARAQDRGWSAGPARRPDADLRKAERTAQRHMASPFLPAGATSGDSGGELSSGDDSGDVESLQSPETEASRGLAQLFEKAAARVQGLMAVASREQLLYLYARYKQVKSQVGVDAGEPPEAFSFL